ncbi:MAG TPA: hypothetical protein VGL15_14445 [Vicinamibacteria bacterium]|jgi:exopolyphosphatase/guanosine-5'-triphosphate,3'-diphosphate pyrophosphatase
MALAERCHYDEAHARQIRNGELRGFEPAEIDLIASVGRYHRRRPPSRKHAFFAALAEPSRRPVKVLAAQLRLADALESVLGLPIGFEASQAPDTETVARERSRTA